MARWWQSVWSPLRRKRRRNPAAIIGGAIILIALAAGAAYATTNPAIVTAAAFARARVNPTSLRAFLYPMPKGGDLHMHLSGGVYAERYIAWAVADGLCMRNSDATIVDPPCDATKGLTPMQSAADDQASYDRIVNALSMRYFLPTPAEPSGHDHFFAAFGKFSAVSGPSFERMVVDQLRSYQEQSAQYVEMMTSFSSWNERQAFDKAVAGGKDFPAKLSALEQAGLAEFVTQKRAELAQSVQKINALRYCGGDKSKPGCAVDYRFIAQVSRNAPLDDVFVQTAIAAALVCSDPMVVGFNYVQAEDALIAHITQAVEIAGAERIGQGVERA